MDKTLQTSNKSIELKQSGITLVTCLVLLLIGYQVLMPQISIVSAVFFHPDESHWISSSDFYFQKFFVEQDWDYETWRDDHFGEWSTSNPVIGKYLIGASLYLFEPSQGARYTKRRAEYDYRESFEWNVDQGSIPPLEEIVAARWPVVWMTILSSVLLFLLARDLTGHRSVGVVAALLFMIDPLVLYSGLRAMIDMPALFFSLLALWVALRMYDAIYVAAGRGDRPAYGTLFWSLGLGVACGLAVGTKLNALLVGVVCAAWGVLNLLWLYSESCTRRRPPPPLGVGAGKHARGGSHEVRLFPFWTTLRSGVVAALLVVLLFVALNPFLYVDTFQNITYMYEFGQRVAEYDVPEVLRLDSWQKSWENLLVTGVAESSVLSRYMSEESWICKEESPSEHCLPKAKMWGRPYTVEQISKNAWIDGMFVALGLVWNVVLIVQPNLSFSSESTAAIRRRNHSFLLVWLAITVVGIWYWTPFAWVRWYLPLEPCWAIFEASGIVLLLTAAQKASMPVLDRLWPRRLRQPAFQVRIAIAAILLTFVMLATWYSVAIPIGEGVDEVHHFDYTKYVKEEWKLPVQRWDENGPRIDVWMGHHPPMYYALTALACVWCDVSDRYEVLQPNPHFVWDENEPQNGWNVQLHTEAERWPYQGTILAMHYLRLLSVLMGAIIVFAVYKIGRIILPQQPWVAVAAAALVAFTPSFLFMSSTIHHDVLIAMLFTLSLWWMVRALRQAPTRRESVVGGFLLGAALLTKLSGLGLVFLFGLTLLLVGWNKRRTQEKEGNREGLPLHLVIQHFFVLYGTAFLLAGWWFVRNLLLYQDVLALNALFNVFTHMQRQEAYSWFIFRHEFLSQLSRTLWAAFGYMHITLSWNIQRVFWMGAAIATLAAFVTAFVKWRDLRSQKRWQYGLLLLSATIIVFVSFVRLSVSMLGAGQGRYLFTIAAPLGLLLAIGLNALLAFRAQRAVAAGVTVGMCLFGFLTMQRFVIPLYAAPETTTTEHIASLPAGDLIFGDALKLAAYEWQPATVSPEQHVTLTLYWQAVGEQRPSLYIHLYLRDRFGNTIAQEEFWPVPSYTTAAWDNQTIYVTRHHYFIPENVAVGRSPLELTVQPGREREPLIAHNMEGTELGTAPQAVQLFIGQANTADSAAIAAQFPRSEILGEKIALLGYDLPQKTLQASDSAEINLYWQGLAQMERNYTVFVQILNEQGQLVAQQDNEPNQGQFPTSLWQPGEIIRDPYAIELPADLPPGQYTIIIGMYEWPSLERLPIIIDGAVQGDAIILDVISVSE
ncbi:MAG: ArnT family glycosyltransferase [Ardenticatenaceae bacterium]